MAQKKNLYISIVIAVVRFRSETRNCTLIILLSIECGTKHGPATLNDHCPDVQTSRLGLICISRYGR